MHNCFKTWAYWRPILILFWFLGGSYVFFSVSSGSLIDILLIIIIVALLLFFIHIMGFAFYESYMEKIKKNYKGITGKNWDEN